MTKQDCDCFLQSFRSDVHAGRCCGLFAAVQCFHALTLLFSGSRVVKLWRWRMDRAQAPSLAFRLSPRSSRRHYRGWAIFIPVQIHRLKNGLFWHYKALTHRSKFSLFIFSRQRSMPWNKVLRVCWWSRPLPISNSSSPTCRWDVKNIWDSIILKHCITPVFWLLGSLSSR